MAVDRSAPATGVFDVVPSDANLFDEPARSLYVGGAGDVAVVANDNTEGIFVGVPAGTVLSVECKQVKSTGTTATFILGLL